MYNFSFKGILYTGLFNPECRFIHPPDMLCGKYNITGRRSKDIIEIIYFDRNKESALSTISVDIGTFSLSY